VHHPMPLGTATDHPRMTRSCACIERNEIRAASRSGTSHTHNSRSIANRSSCRTRRSRPWCTWALRAAEQEAGVARPIGLGTGTFRNSYHSNRLTARTALYVACTVRIAREASSRTGNAHCCSTLIQCSWHSPESLVRHQDRQAGMAEGSQVVAAAVTPIHLRTRRCATKKKMKGAETVMDPSPPRQTLYS
jgi:hypothetical protein